MLVGKRESRKQISSGEREGKRAEMGRVSEAERQGQGRKKPALCSGSNKEQSQ